METIARPTNSAQESLLALRKKTIDYINRTEDEDLLTEVALLLSGEKRPCSYTPEEFVSVLAEAEEDYKAGRYITQEEMRKKYGL